MGGLGVLREGSFGVDKKTNWELMQGADLLSPGRKGRISN
jgi:hypothetical protein